MIRRTLFDKMVEFRLKRVEFRVDVGVGPDVGGVEPAGTRDEIGENGTATHGGCL